MKRRFGTGCALHICCFTRRILLSSIPQRVRFRKAECYVQISEIPVIPDLKVNKILDQLKAFQLFCQITYGRHKPHLTWINKQAVHRRLFLRSILNRKLNSVDKKDIKLSFLKESSKVICDLICGRKY